MAKYGESKYGEGKYGPRVGYVVLLKPGSAPVAGVDTPVANLSPLADSAALDMTALALTADTDHFGAVVPYNESGFADSPATFAFRTDGEGNPLIAPAAVTNLRATALAGGNLKVEWEYDEPNPMAVADSFIVALDIDWFVGPVSHTPPKRHYSFKFVDLPDGLRKISVKAARLGVSSPSATVQAVADATPPLATALGISAG